MKVILKIEKNPLIKTYQHQAYAFSILGNSEESKWWMINNFLQLIYAPEYTTESFNYHTDFLTRQGAFEWEGVSDDTLDLYKIDRLPYIENGLNQAKYAWLCLDEFYIKDSIWYQKEHMFHDTLVYGYDNERKIFYKIGHNKNGIYCTSEIEYNIFKKSNPCMIKFIGVKNNYKIKIDIVKIRNTLLKYLNVLEENLSDEMNYKTTYFHRKEKYERSYYGIKACEEINNIIVRQIKTNQKIDLRITSLILEHKKVILECINILDKNKIISCEGEIMEYNKVLKYANIYQNLCIKYNLKNDLKISMKIEEVMKLIILKEKKILLNICDKLCSQDLNLYNGIKNICYKN